MWQGRVLAIHIAEEASAAMESLRVARLIAGEGIEGDRYCTGRGFYSHKPESSRQVTLFEEETLHALARDHRIELRPEEHRRNITVRGVPLNHLVGKTFRLGAAVLYGGRLNRPCRYLDDLLGKSVYRLLLNRSGLNCEIRIGGVVRPGDPVRPLED
jgi:MOSC domain-containing protein YiiM